MNVVKPQSFFDFLLEIEIIINSIYYYSCLVYVNKKKIVKIILSVRIKNA